jgi:hypothetical protein
LSVRATDERGRKQPLDREPDRADSFEFNVPQTIRITVT